MKLRRVTVVDPMMSTMTPKKGTERAMARRSRMTTDRKTTLFQPKAGEDLTQMLILEELTERYIQYFFK